MVSGACCVTSADQVQSVGGGAHRKASEVMRVRVSGSCEDAIGGSEARSMRPADCSQAVGAAASIANVSSLDSTSSTASVASCGPWNVLLWVPDHRCLCFSPQCARVWLCLANSLLFTTLSAQR